MTQTPKQWATTGFIVGVACGIVAVFIVNFFLKRNESTASAAQPFNIPAPIAAANSAPVSVPASSQRFISGTIELDPSAARSVALPTIVFVIARGEGLRLHGHPLLAKRLDVRSFPVDFTLGSEDSMMGQAPPNRVSLEARVDRDGDATTREPGAPAALIESVTLGTEDVKLVLKPTH
jgi:hypothetical protein